MADLITIGVKVNASAAVDEVMRQLDGLEKKVDGREITYKITGDATELQKTMNNLKSAQFGSIALNIDDSLYKKTLQSMQSITETRGKTIGEQFKNAINKGLTGFNVREILTEFDKTRYSATSLDSVFKQLKTSVSSIDSKKIKELGEAGNYDEIRKYVEQYEKLAIIAKELTKSENQTQRVQYTIKDFNDITKQFGSVFSTDVLNDAISDYETTAQNEFNRIINSLINEINDQTDGAVEALKNGVEEQRAAIQSELDGLNSDINKALSNIKDLYKKLDVEIDESDVNAIQEYNKVVQEYIQTYQEYLKAGGTTSRSTAKYQEKYNDLVVESGLTGQSARTISSSEEAKANRERIQEDQKQIANLTKQIEEYQKVLDDTSAISNIEAQKDAMDKLSESADKAAESMKDESSAVGEGTGGTGAIDSHLQELYQRRSELEEAINTWSSAKDAAEEALQKVYNTTTETMSKNTALINNYIKAYEDYAKAGKLFDNSEEEDQYDSLYESLKKARDGSESFKASMEGLSEESQDALDHFYDLEDQLDEIDKQLEEYENIKNASTDTSGIDAQSESLGNVAESADRATEALKQEGEAAESIQGTSSEAGEVSNAQDLDTIISNLKEKRKELADEYDQIKKEMDDSKASLKQSFESASNVDTSYIDEYLRAYEKFANVGGNVVNSNAFKGMLSEDDKKQIEDFVKYGEMYQKIYNQRGKTYATSFSSLQQRSNQIDITQITQLNEWKEQLRQVNEEVKEYTAAMKTAEGAGGATESTEKTTEANNKAAESAEKSAEANEKAAEATERLAEANDKASESTQKASQSSSDTAESTSSNAESMERIAESAERAASALDKVADSAEKVVKSIDSVTNGMTETGDSTEQVSESSDKAAQSMEQEASAAEKLSDAASKVTESTSEIAKNNEETSTTNLEAQSDAMDKVAESADKAKESLEKEMETAEKAQKTTSETKETKGIAEGKEKQTEIKANIEDVTKAIEDKTQATKDDEAQMEESASNQINILKEVKAQAEDAAGAIASMSGSGASGGGGGGDEGGTVDVSNYKSYEYFADLPDSITQSIEQIKRTFENADFSNVKISGIEALDGEIQHLTVTATDSEQALKTFNYSLQQATLGDFDLGFALISSDDVSVNESNLLKIESMAEHTKQVLNDLGSVDSKGLESSLQSATTAVENLENRGVSTQKEYTALVNVFKEFRNIEVNKGMESGFSTLQQSIQEATTSFSNGEMTVEGYTDKCKNLINAFNEMSKTTQQMGSSGVLDITGYSNNGVEYFSKVYNSVDKMESAIQKRFTNNGYSDVNVSGIEQLNGKIKELTVSATNANGALEKFHYTRQKVQENGQVKKNGYLVADDEVKVSEANLEKVEQAAQEAQESIQKLMNVDDRNLTSGAKSASNAIQQMAESGVKAKNEYTAVVDTFRTLSSINISSGMESSFTDLENKISNANTALANGEMDLKSYKNTCNSAVKDFNNISKALDQTATKLNTMSFDSDFSSQFDVLKTNIGDLNEQLTSGAISIDEYKTKVNDAVKEFTNMETAAKSVVESFNSINADTTVLSSDQFTQAQAAVDGLNEKLRTNQQVTQEDVQAVQQAVDAYKQLADAGTIIATDLSFENAAKSAEDYASTLGTVVKTNNQLSNEGVSTMAIQVRTATGEVQNLQFTYNAAMNTMSAQTVSLNKTLGNTTNLLDTFKTKLTNLSMYWTASLLNPMKLINVVKQGVSSITEMDTALTEMRRVSDETVTSLQNFQDISFELGNSIGVAAIDIQNSAADFMRLGYSLEDATEFARDANIYANVGLMDIDTATEHMVSSIKAWGDQFDSEIEASSAIIDRYNEIGKLLPKHVVIRGAKALKVGITVKCQGWFRPWKGIMFANRRNGSGDFLLVD